MATQVSQYVPYAVNTRIKLLENISGAKQINGQWIDHQLPAGTTVFIRANERSHTRTSINTDPLSEEDFMYKLETKLVENIPQEVLEGPYVGHNPGQKIPHTALDTTRCPPSGLYGMFKVGQRPYIRPGNQYTYHPGSQPVTLKGGDMIRIDVPGTTKSGNPSVKIPNNAYYLTVHKVRRFVAPMELTWRSKHSVSSAKFEVVHGA